MVSGVKDRLVGCDCELALHSKHQEHQTPTLLMVARLSIAMREPETEVTFHSTPENALCSRKAPWMPWAWPWDSGWVIALVRGGDKVSECAHLHASLRTNGVG